MRIGIDCRLAGHRHAGIGRYIAELVQRLPQQAPDIEWVFFFFDSEQEAEILEQIREPFLKNVQSRIVPIRHYSLGEQISLPYYLHREQLDLLHVPHFNVPLAYRGKFVMTIHDLLWHEYRGNNVTTLNPVSYWLKYAAYRWITAEATTNSQAIIVPAQTIKATVKKYYPRVA